MGVIQIRKAKREGARLVIALAAWTGKGKTYSAIQLGYGLANYDASKLGFLDAENRRGSLCADILQRSTVPTDEPFLIADLYPPFTPERYIAAIQEFQQAGIDVLVIDSSSHEWEGTGGCIEIADANPKNGWAQPKARHKKFVNALLQCDMHIIVCVRAREKDKPETIMKDGQQKTVYVDLGLQPIQEKNFMFEMSASLMMFDEGRRQQILKCPSDLLPYLGRQDGYLTSDDGKAIRDWVDGAKQLNPTIEKFRNRLISICDGGEAKVTECWNMTPANIRQELGEEFRLTLLSSGKEYDKLRAESQGAGGGTTEAGSDPAAASIAAVAKANIERSQRAAAAAPESKQAPIDPPITAEADAPSTEPPAQPAAAAQPAASQPPTAAASQPSTPPRQPASNTPAPRPARTSSPPTRAAASTQPPAVTQPALRPQSEPLF